MKLIRIVCLVVIVGLVFSACNSSKSAFDKKKGGCGCNKGTVGY